MATDSRVNRILVGSTEPAKELKALLRRSLATKIIAANVNKVATAEATITCFFIGFP
jgi:hypothetical protein